MFLVVVGARGRRTGGRKKGLRREGVGGLRILPRSCGIPHVREILDWAEAESGNDFE